MKHNKVFLCGMVVGKPRIIKEENGQYKSGTISLSVVRNDRYTGDTDKQLRQDVIFVKSDNEDIIKKMDSVSTYDQIYVKGVLVTKSKEKISICPECQMEQVQNGMIVYVHPIHVEVLDRNLTGKESIDLLYSRREISNDINVIGNLCTDPIKVEALKKTPIAQYQIAVPRTLRIDEEKTDFPWIKVYGKYANEDMKRLRTGSGVMVEGYLQARSVQRKSECTCCGSIYTWSDYAMEIVPYEVEYLSNYVTDEELGMMAGTIN